MDGISGSLDYQVAFLRDAAHKYAASFPSLLIHENAVKQNGSDEGYGLAEADFLYSFVRRHKPKRIVQAGCGVSTAICLMAARDEQYHPQIVCIEPYPTKFLRDAHGAGNIELVSKKLEDLDAAFFEQIEEGDLFFVDSSHTLGPAGEVSRIILGILPQLPVGAFAHFHDIWFPYDYCPNVLTTDLFFFHETVLLHAFLCMNEYFQVEASLSRLFHERQEELRLCLPRLEPAKFKDGLMLENGHFPSSIFLRRVK